MRIHHPASRLLALFIFVLSMGASSLALSETTGQYIDDATITTKVKTALLAEAPLKSLQIGVETNQGVVELAGTVDTRAQESDAVRVTKQVKGVKSVKNSLTVRETP
ncbi:MAG: BON domain-containing protein [Alphaproteobacteria bacterium]|nr:BON domain-containing protein [Alphaproteobacteria bacterium]